ncbi:hypothetical protein SK128_015728, partial [Halocaridina rubra]
MIFLVLGLQIPGYDHQSSPGEEGFASSNQYLEGFAYRDKNTEGLPSTDNYFGESVFTKHNLYKYAFISSNLERFTSTKQSLESTSSTKPYPTGFSFTDLYPDGLVITGQNPKDSPSTAQYTFDSALTNLNQGEFISTSQYPEELATIKDFKSLHQNAQQSESFTSTGQYYVGSAAYSQLFVTTSSLEQNPEHGNNASRNVSDGRSNGEFSEYLISIDTNEEDNIVPDLHMDSHAATEQPEEFITEQFLCNSSGYPVFEESAFTDRNSTSLSSIHESNESVFSDKSLAISILPADDECGRNSQFRIIGGVEIQVRRSLMRINIKERMQTASWPWLVTIGQHDKDGSFYHTCGGAVITRRHVLTAAHCFIIRITKPTHVQLGAHDLRENQSPMQEIKIESYRLHSFDRKNFTNDIALVILDREVEFNALSWAYLHNFNILCALLLNRWYFSLPTDFIRPVCLPLHFPEKNSNFVGEQLTVLGWGRVSISSNDNSDVPREVIVPGVPLSKCRIPEFQIDDRNICAGETGKDSCSSDGTDMAAKIPILLLFLVISAAAAQSNVDEILASLFGTSNRQSLNPLPNSATTGCLLPSGEIGSCGPLSRCPLYVPLIRQLSDPDTINFFRQRICLIADGTLNICCPESNPSGAPQPSGGEPSIIPTVGECGLPSGDRIINGTEIGVASWPWLAAIGAPIENGGFRSICGGTLITRRHVLSAAHCFVAGIPESERSHVRLGEHHLTRENDGAFPQDFRIASRRSNEYNDFTKENDIELLILAQDVTYNTFIRPACLPIQPRARDNNYEGRIATVVGWGALRPGRFVPTSSVPMETDVPVVPLGPCANVYERRTLNTVVDNRNLCAGTGVTDACRVSHVP